MDDSRGVDGAQDVHQFIAELEGLDDRDAVAALLAVSLERVALEEVHREEDAAVVGHAVVEDADDPRVLDRVREVALAEEPLAHGGVGAEGRMEDLERRARSVAVRHGVDRRHGPRPEQRIHAPLTADDGPYPPLGLLTHSLGNPR